MTLELRYAVRSDVGLLREGNEDSAFAGPRLLAVADGMGGHAAGEVASSLTISAISELETVSFGTDMLEALAAAVGAANARLHEKILANPAVEGMGTTLTALLWSDGHAAVCHIGDSRGYLLREGELYQITHDHTLVQSLVDEGRISVDDVATHPQRSLLLRALDGRSSAEPDLSVHDSLVGDRYLLCSDGLSGVVSDEMLRDTLASVEDPDAATRQLIELAINGGGPDNITCIVADVVDTATTQLPLTTTPVLAGAAATMAEAEAPDGTGPIHGLDDHHDGFGPPLAQSAAGDLDPMMTSAGVPLTMDDDGLDYDEPLGRRGHRARSRRPSRRRWPIVTTALVVLAAVVIGGGYVFWRVSQNQYYVGTDSNNQVVIYRGISQRIVGLSWSSPYQQTGILLSQVPSNYQQTVKTDYSTGSLTQVRQTVTTIQSAVDSCRNAYVALAQWKTDEDAYTAAVNAAKKQKKPVNGIAKPGPQPDPAPALCPAPAVFGIETASLPSSTPGSA